MARFNEKRVNPRETRNFEGGKAYTYSPELELYALASTTMMDNISYKSSADKINDIKRLIRTVSPEYAMKLAKYVRTDMQLRSVPFVILVELAKVVSEKQDVELSRMFERAIVGTIQRADEITEILSYYKEANGLDKLNKLSKPLQRAIATSFGKFNEYQLAKYYRKTAITLKDALFLSHVKPENEERQKLYTDLVNDTLEIPYTWEVELSSVGHDATPEEKIILKRAKWEELIDSGKLGYMALLRNLRNILQAEVSRGHIVKVCDRLADKNQVLKSRQLPFRFLSAYIMIAGVSGRYGSQVKGIESPYAKIVLDALEKAVLYSVDTMKEFVEGDVLVASDVSGSMQHPISERSSVDQYFIGLLLGALITQKNKFAVHGMFGNTWKIMPPSTGNVLRNTIEMIKREGEVGYSTNGYLIIDDLIAKKKKMDKIMIFTDCQLWNSNTGGYSDGPGGGHGGNISSSWATYKQMYPDSKLYLFDMSGHGTMPLDIDTEKNVFMISGWSDKVFDMFSAVDNGENAVEIINSIEL